MIQHKKKELDKYYIEHNEMCENCGAKFQEGMWVHVGYLINEKPAVLCDKCSGLLKVKEAQYYWSKNEYEKPDPNDKLWRYMDIAKFIHLISCRKLFFASADSFEDPFEGAKGITENKKQWDDFYLEFCKNAIKTAPGIIQEKLTVQCVEETAKGLLNQLNAIGEQQRKRTFISCWHSNEFESEAMWKIYANNIQNAVAIQTTADHLNISLDKKYHISIGKVKYIDYNNNFTSVNNAYWYKRKSFEFEHEVRAIIYEYEKDSKGVLIPVNIDLLVDGVYISPYAPKWFEEVVYSVMEKYGVKASVYTSDMKKIPFY